MFRKLVGTVSLLALLMAGLYTVSAQDKADTPAPIRRETAEPPPAVVTPSPSPVPAPVEEMLQRLAEIKEQRRQLERQEELLVDQLRTKMKHHTDRLKALGYDLVPQLVVPSPQPADGALIAPPPAPTRGTD